MPPFLFLFELLVAIYAECLYIFSMPYLLFLTDLPRVLSEAVEIPLSWRFRENRKSLGVPEKRGRVLPKATRELTRGGGL